MIQPQCRDAVSALRALEAVHLVQSSAAVFVDVYTRVTREVVELLDSGVHDFHDPLWLSECTGTFADMALSPLISADSFGVTAAWRMAVAPGRTLRPYQHALLGVNAHINSDLPRVVLESALVSGKHIEYYRHDFFQVTTILAAVMQDCLTMLAGVHHDMLIALLLALPDGRRRLGTAALALIKNWRAIAWFYAVSLYEAHPAQRTQILTAVDQRAQLIAEFVID